MRLQHLFIILCTVVTGCSDQENDFLLLRIQNLSGHDYEEIFVHTGFDEHNFGDIESGSVSEYVPMEGAYRYGYIQLFISTDTLVLQPIDYVGETPLKNGKYTYAVDADTASKHLTLFLSKDQ